MGATVAQRKMPEVKKHDKDIFRKRSPVAWLEGKVRVHGLENIHREGRARLSVNRIRRVKQGDSEVASEHHDERTLLYV